MRINSDRLFPHPVLRKDNGNFVSSKFEVISEYKHNNLEYEFKLNVDLDEINLLNLLKKGKVSMFCHLECPKTKFRSIIPLNTGENTFLVDVKSVDGRLELVTLIVAKEDIEEYYSKDFDQEYGNNSFSIKKGNILAIADMPTVNVENLKENLSNLPSIFDISYTEESLIMKLDLREDRIKILLPFEEYKIRNSHKDSLHSRNIINTITVLPALVAVLNDLAHKDSILHYGDKRWFRVINKKLIKLGYNLEEGTLENETIFDIAQELLEDLFSEAMNSIKYLDEVEK